MITPDVILEDPHESAERDTKLLFVKTCTDSEGQKYTHFESVTVSKENKEVVISNKQSHCKQKRSAK